MNDIIYFKIRKLYDRELYKYIKKSNTEIKQTFYLCIFTYSLATFLAFFLLVNTTLKDFSITFKFDKVIFYIYSFKCLFFIFSFLLLLIEYKKKVQFKNIVELRTSNISKILEEENYLNIEKINSLITHIENEKSLYKNGDYKKIIIKR